jgi:hypothetical protein
MTALSYNPNPKSGLCVAGNEKIPLMNTTVAKTDMSGINGVVDKMDNFGNYLRGSSCNTIKVGSWTDQMLQG